MSDLSSTKKVVIFRHGERVDFTFGENWFTKCFENGKYVRTDLNLPESLQERDLENWKHDCPLTTIGMMTAKLTGSSLKSNGCQFDYAISTPSYRCVQTCHGILQGRKNNSLFYLKIKSIYPLEMGCASNIPIKIEPGLFDWFFWSNRNWPVWSSDDELAKSFNIDIDYKSVMSRKELASYHNENLKKYYERNYQTMKKLLKRYCELSLK